MAANTEDPPEGILAQIQQKYHAWKASTMALYEMRLRGLAHPLKTFQYFASTFRGDQAFMTPGDLLRSLMPLRLLGADAAEARHGRPQKVASANEFFRVLDLNGDGLISFPEYLFFVTLSSLPPQVWTTAFRLMDRDGSGTLTASEFGALYDQLGASVAAYQRVGAVEWARAREGLDRCHGVMRLFFGPHGHDELRLADFAAFMAALHDQVRRFEFFQYRAEREPGANAPCTIPLGDFARAMVSYAPARLLPRYLERIRRLPEYDERVTLEQFCEFDRALQTRLDDLDRAAQLMAWLDQPLDGPELQRVLSVATGLFLTDSQADVLCRLVGGDGEQAAVARTGDLLALLRSRAFRGARLPMVPLLGATPFLDGFRRWFRFEN